MGPEANRERLTGLRNGLMRLHKVLLDSERDVYDHEVQRIRSSGQLLDLVMNDPHFAWLHEVSELIVMIDETLDDPEAEVDPDKLIGQTREMLTPSENGSGFGRRYFEAMQRDPNVVLAHADMLKVLAALR